MFGLFVQEEEGEAFALMVYVMVPPVGDDGSAVVMMRVIGDVWSRTYLRQTREPNQTRTILGDCCWSLQGERMS